MSFGDLFGDLFGFGSAEKPVRNVKADLLTRIRDLEEIAGGTGDRLVLARVQSRCRRHKVTDEQWAAFLLAWRKDLEMAGHHGLLNKDADKEKGHHSLSAAYCAYADAERGYWEWSLTRFKQAVEYAPTYWGRCVKACEALVDTLAREPDVEPVQAPTLKELFDRFDVRDTEARKGLTAAHNAKTPLEWMEGWTYWCENSVVFGDMMPPEVMEKVRAGEWKDLLAFEAQKKERVGYENKVVKDDDGNVIMETRHARPQRSVVGFAGSLMGDLGKIKWLKKIKDSDNGEWAANLPRVVQALWWGMDETPEGWDRLEKDGKWFLVSKVRKPQYDYTTRKETPDGRTEEERRHKALHPDGHAGFDSEKELMREVWHRWIYKNGSEKEV